MGRRYDLVVFDMDGVLTKPRSSWGYVHDEMGVNNDDSLEAFNRGEIDEAEFIRRDIGLWLDKDPDITERDMIHILRTMPWIDGIQETVSCLHYNNMKCVICSGGLEWAAKMVMNEYDFDECAAVHIDVDEDGRLTGTAVRNVDLGDKGKRTREFIEHYGTTPERTATIGNSYTDVKMMEGTGLKIAFNPTDEAVTDIADVVIRSDNISDILNVILQNENGY